MLLACDTLFLVTFQESMIVAVKEPVMESAFSSRLLWRPFLINLDAFTITGSEEVCDGV